MNQATERLNQISVNPFDVKFQSGCCEALPQSSDPIAILVTSEYEGIFKNGGIGTYYKTLSEKLATTDENFKIILILCQTQKKFQGKSTLPHVSHIFSVNEVGDCLELQSVHFGILSQFKKWEWVESESYKVLFLIQAIASHFPDSYIYIEFPDLCGFGYRTIQAKRAGILGQNCITAVTLHSGQEWLNEAHDKYNLGDGWNWFKNIYSYEQYAFENADLAFFLSFFMEEKVRSYGWKTAHARHLPYCFPIVPFLNPNRPLLTKLGLNIKREQIPIIFFGRLESRKGLLTFIEAIQQLEESMRSRLYLLFLGKVVPLDSISGQKQNSREYIERELGGKFSYTILSDLFSQEAIALVQELAPAVVCLTSPQENFPNSALEMGQLPVSLVVSDTGGFRETLNLINRSDGVRWFNPGNSQSLRSAIIHATTVYPEIPDTPPQKFLEQVNYSLFQQRLAYMKQDFTRTSASPSVDEDSSSLLLGMTSRQEQIFLRDFGSRKLVRYPVIVP